MRPSNSLWLLVLTGLACEQATGAARGTVSVGSQGEGVEVTLFGPASASTQTQRDGTWEVRDLPAGSYAVVASAADTRERSVTTTIDVRPHYVTETPALSLTPVGTVSGHAVGRASKTPVAVLVVGVGGVQTGPDGAFTVTDVPTGTRDVVFYASGFAQRRLTGVEVSRGVTVLESVELEPLDSALASLVGTLEGSARIPGVENQGGIVVEVEGTALSTTTAVDGTFRIPNVPNGVVTLVLRRGAASARVGRVLVLSGSSGFIIDGGLYPLDTNPIPLRVGTPVAMAVGGAWLGVEEVSDDWAVVQWLLPVSPENALWLMGRDGRRAVISREALPRLSNYRIGHSGMGFVGDEYRFVTLDQRTSTFSLNRTSLTTLRNTVVQSWPVSPQLQVIAMGSPGAAWIESRALFLKTQAAPAVKLLTSAEGVVWLRDGTLLASDGRALRRYQRDGTPLDSIPFPPPVTAPLAGLWLTADERFAVAGTGVSSQVTLPGVLIDLQSSTTRALLGCDWATASPDSKWLACFERASIRLIELETGTTTTLGLSRCGRNAEWLPRLEHALAMFCPPLLRVHQPGSVAEVAGVSWENNDLFVTSRGAVRLFARADPVTGLGQAVELSMADGGVTVLADGVLPAPFLASHTGALVARPRSFGTDVDLSFVDNGGAEHVVGRTHSRLVRVSASPAGTFFTGWRRGAWGFEAWLLDTRPQANPKVSATSFAHYRSDWLGDHFLFQTDREDAPFSAASGLYSLELP